MIIGCFLFFLYVFVILRKHHEITRNIQFDHNMKKVKEIFAVKDCPERKIAFLVAHSRKSFSLIKKLYFRKVII